MNKAGWMQTYPTEDGYHEVVLEIGEGVVGSSEDLDFGNIAVTTLTGAKWNDEDKNGYRGEGENGIEGWTITATPMIEVLEETSQEESEDGLRFF